jgi:hypothetical protein
MDGTERPDCGLAAVLCDERNPVPLTPGDFPHVRWRRAAPLGLAFAAAYVLVAGVSFRGGLLPALPLDDGGAPPAPYQWVKPPPDRVKDNQPPTSVDQTVPLGQPGSVTTPDTQAQLIIDNNSIPPQPGQTMVRVTINPLDPDKVGPPSPGLHYHSNAYAITALYEPSNQAVPQLSVVVVLSYTTSADRVMRWNGSSWDSLQTTPAGANQLFATADKLGTFVAAGPLALTPAKRSSPVVLVVAVLVPFLLVVTILVLVLGRARRR